MEYNHLTGLIAAPFTPMHKDGSLNLSLIPAYYQMLRSNRVTGAFICGSTGEGVSLSLAEKKQVAEAWAAVAGGDAGFKLITLIGGTCVIDCIDLAIHAKAHGFYAVSYTAPFYFKPDSVRTIVDIGTEIAKNVPGMPVYYYHIPVLTGVNFPMIDLLKEVDGRVDNFAGIKYTYEDLEDYQRCVQYGGGKYDMLWGRDELMIEALAQGAKGSVGSTFNYASSLYINLMEAFEKGDRETAKAYQQQACDMIDLLGKYGGIATGKAFMKQIGLDCGEFRLPVKNMSGDQMAKFIQDAKNLGFDKYCNKMPMPANVQA
jgi:N-acetylneuraminate lyase